MRIEIRDGRQRTFNHRDFLKSSGFYFRKDAWIKETNDAEFVLRVEQVAKRRGLSCLVYEYDFSRSNSYRDDFFISNKGLFGKGIYPCAYCGRLLRRDEVTVDHVIPVQAVVDADTRDKYRSILKRRGITNVNDPGNLVAACRSCNSRKGKKTGMWIVRGFLGSHTCYWIIVYTAFLCAAAAIIAAVLS